MATRTVLIPVMSLAVVCAMGPHHAYRGGEGWSLFKDTWHLLVSDPAGGVDTCAYSCLYLCGSSQRSLLAAVLTILTQSGMEDEPQGPPQAPGILVHASHA